MRAAGEVRDDGGRRARSQGRVQSSRADLGGALVEALAWAGDRLSDYAQRLGDDAYVRSGRHGRGQPRSPRGPLAGQGIGIDVDGARWRQVPDFAGSTSDDQHYVVRHDDGATVVEFGDGVHGHRPSSGTSIGVLYRAGTRYSSVLLQQGRVVLDGDVAEPAPLLTCGVYRGTVTQDADPLGQRRLQVRVPGVSGDQDLWAAACLPPGGADRTFSIGDDVWVAFESGDPARPVWIGRPAASPH